MGEKCEISFTVLTEEQIGMYILDVYYTGKTWHSGDWNEMSQKLLTFSWHLRSVAIWEPYDCWQIGMSAQACTTWPHWALCLSVYNRNIDTILTTAFLHKNTFIPFPAFGSPLKRYSQPVLRRGSFVRCLQGTVENGCISVNIVLKSWAAFKPFGVGFQKQIGNGLLWDVLGLRFVGRSLDQNLTTCNWILEMTPWESLVFEMRYEFFCLW